MVLELYVMKALGINYGIEHVTRTIELKVEGEMIVESVEFMCVGRILGFP